ncbi:T9SS type A sorting domain-containing protein [Flavobacterium sp.]|uniref:T9SS type A sorting domain-containing protein n=1 Tax=Flavobacterium sp. TaxID=239 RepID=UPI003D0968A3
MKKIILLSLLFVGQVKAQLWKVNECSATVSTTTYGPMNTTNLGTSTSNRHIMLYKASELTALQNQSLTKIFFKRATASGTLGGNPTAKIYLKETNLTDLGSANLDWATEIAGATKVYDANPTTAVGNTAGYKDFSMSTPFNYTNQSLMVLVEYSNTAANATRIDWFYEFGSACLGTSVANIKYISSNSSSIPGNTLSTSNTRRPVIGFDYTVPCPRPTNAVATPATTSATISWTAGNNETQWEYAVTPYNAAAPTSGTTTTSNSLSINNLTEGTYYKLYVRAICSATESSIWTSPIVFLTGCTTPTNVPFVENFETQPTNLAPTCTKITNNGTGNIWDVTTNPGSGFTTTVLQYSYNLSSPANTWFFTKGINLEQGKKYKVTFDYGNNLANTVEKLKVAVGTTQNAVDMTTVLVDDPNVTGATLKNGTGTFTAQTTGVYYLGFQAYSDANKFKLYVDNINLIEDTTLSTDDQITHKSVVSPNPFTSQIVVKNEKEIKQISVYNLLGSEVIKQATQSNQIELTTDFLQNGAYILKVQTEEGTQTFKLFKN